MPKQVDHGERRAAIALGVVGVIAEHGIGAVSVRSVARAAGVSTGQVQHYFATKADLVLHACRLFVDRATEQHAATAGAPPRERLEHLLVMGIPATPDQRVGAAVWQGFVTAAVTDARLAEVIASAWRARRDSVVELLTEIDPGSALPVPVLADLLAATADGLTTRAIVGDVDQDDARATMHAHCVALGIGTAPGQVCGSHPI